MHLYFLFFVFLAYPTYVKSNHSQTCDIAMPCSGGSTNISLYKKVQDTYQLIHGAKINESFMTSAGLQHIPGNSEDCPLPVLPRKLPKKPRAKILRNFYKHMAGYIQMVYKVTKTTSESVQYSNLTWILKSKFDMPLCTIMCLSYTQINSHRKVKRIAKKSYKDFQKHDIDTENAACQLYQTTQILEALENYLQNSLSVLERFESQLNKAKKRRSRRHNMKNKRRKGKGRRKNGSKGSKKQRKAKRGNKKRRLNSRRQKNKRT